MRKRGVGNIKTVTYAVSGKQAKRFAKFRRKGYSPYRVVQD